MSDYSDLQELKTKMKRLCAEHMNKMMRIEAEGRQTKRHHAKTRNLIDHERSAFYKDVCAISGYTPT